MFTRLINALAYRQYVREVRCEQDHHIATGRLTVGANTYGLFRVSVQRGDPAHAKVNIGAFCSIGEHVIFMPGGNHRYDWVSTYPFRARYRLPDAYADGHPASKGPIVVGNDVWIGRGATILSGVNIGNGAIVGAEAVIATSVRPYAIVAGNPARELRRRFDDETVARLEEVAWWDWPLDRILDSVPLLNEASVHVFLEAAGGQ